MDGLKQLSQYLFGVDEADIGQEQMEKVKCALENLSADDKTLISKRYGIGEDKQHSFKELAAMFGTDWEWVWRQETRILSTLKKQLGQSKKPKTERK